MHTALTNPEDTVYDHLGRNGYVKARGVAITALPRSPVAPSQVFLEPIDSRGNIARGRIVVHADLIDDLIAALQHAKSELAKSNEQCAEKCALSV